ncbi:MAG TPA: thymidine phosphorylase [Candidatus Marinimicrobia bacterium]|nr:thymidine phosphorylase [Candidatus Neomarinimicrobiota bacterium]
MLPQEIIRKKRDGHPLSDSEIQYYIEGIANGSVSESHIAAFCMAVIFKGMSVEETFSLTDQMVKSGDKLNWKDLDGPVVDKHSTGGVGDKVSLMLAPIVASCGIYNPMISGRGLGHTGGTLDKLESIPEYNTTPDNSLFHHVVKNVGCAIIGQTANLAPADKVIYGVRDVTATVESVPLITASILSKKVAAGLDGLVMDIKTGNGAFAENLDFARNVGNSIIQVAKQFGMKTSAMITDMNQPLGDTIGNALEIKEVIDYLTGVRQESRLHEVVLALAAEMLVVAGLVDSTDEGIQKAKDVLDNGHAAETFEKMVSELGGLNDILKNSDSHFKSASVVKPIPASQSGYVSEIDTRAVGLAVVELGGGRKKASDSIDHSVGFTHVLGLGEKVEVGQPLGYVHAQNEDQANMAIQMVNDAYSISDSSFLQTPTIIEYLK